MLAVPGWDAIADNIAFVEEGQPDIELGLPPTTTDADTSGLTLAALLAGGISRRGLARSELGFLKPLMRRSFLEQHGLRYDEDLRLSEDFLLYAQILAAGGCYLTVGRCGYVAVVREGSLSGRHSTMDLAALLGALDRWAEDAPMADRERALFGRYRRQVSANYRHRRLLDDRRQSGLALALMRALDEPSTLPFVAMRIVRDKLPRPAQPKEAPWPRYLLPV